MNYCHFKGFAMGLLYDYHELLTLRFVKVKNGYVKKAESKPCPLTLQYSISFNSWFDWCCSIDYRAAFLIGTVAELG